eukprot:GHVT01010902.1.p2 GENE.GHVT01010902.1~~GHVT01010902.1.p2  ORF type:complete len:127 (-),score=27.11 GHVT01010902.1:17-397(-)
MSNSYDNRSYQTRSSKARREPHPLPVGCNALLLFLLPAFLPLSTLLPPSSYPSYCRFLPFFLFFLSLLPSSSSFLFFLPLLPSSSSCPTTGRVCVPFIGPSPPLVFIHHQPIRLLGSSFSFIHSTD